MDPPPTSPRRVLVVDDCPDTCAMMEMLLSLWGYEARSARDGPSALELFRAFGPQVILLDIGLPKMDGYEVARRLRKTVDGEKLLVIGVSGFGTESHRRRALEAGCDLYLIKPVNPESLQKLLEQKFAGAQAPANQS